MIEGTPEFNRGHQERISAQERRRELYAKYSAAQAVHGSGERVEQARERLQAFDDRTTHTARLIMQSVMGESPYHSHPTTLDDGIWEAVHRLEEENGLPEGLTAMDVYQSYLKVFGGSDE
jgi:hypothetical protein